MKLSAKIGSGFGALIVIACILGGLSVYNMLKVKNVAQRMVGHVERNRQSLKQHPLSVSFGGVQVQPRHLHAA